MTCHDQGLCRIGWSTSQAALDLGNLHTAQSTSASLKLSVTQGFNLICSQEPINMVLVLEELARNLVTNSLTAMER